MITIHLSNEITRKAFVSVDDAKDVKAHKWFVIRMHDGTEYIGTNITVNGRRRLVLLHRFILEPDDNETVMFLDNDHFNCQRDNLVYRSKKTKVSEDSTTKEDSLEIKWF